MVHIRQGDKALLREISVGLSAGVFVALIGPNGAGKSTLIRCLAGVLPVAEGVVTLESEDVRRIPGSLRARRLSYLPQQLEAPFAFTVGELLQLNGTGFDHAHPALALLELYSLLEQPLNRLSGGERQRAAIARALLADTPYLLLDEPLAHLDPRFALRLLEYLALQARQGKGIVAVLHDLRLARQFSTHLWLLNGGELMFAGQADAISDSLLGKAFGLSGEDLLIFS